MLYYFLLFYLFFAVLMYFIAKRKGQDPIFWAGLGLFFGPLALLFQLFSKNIAEAYRKLAKNKFWA
ncbi:hypothetical protein [Candidatus Nitrosacidococcus tergens]|uniref:Uncharacterized protein n=1 Tax=Candidatus Nitrosacidococcus tergens TaxID=553981 RepID=A0A7G1QBV4_9GAMM|nr:hypothetical protein [Candidatus Nitrosacidococcus tergens]CAB1277282.1 conserved protein of unknown function [Candidatus Nitrosacidococcus tergens]